MAISRLLIANRGEIALRIHRAAHEIGIETVAVHSTADADAMHVRLADHAVCIGPPPAGESYAEELFELHGSAEQIEAHMESEGYSDDEIFVQLRRLGLRRVYVRETCSPA